MSDTGISQPIYPIMLFLQTNLIIKLLQETQATKHKKCKESMSNKGKESLIEFFEEEALED